MNPTNPTLFADLTDRLADCRRSADYVDTIRALAAIRDPRAIDVLAALLDSTGTIAEASIAALLSFGDAAVPAMRRCIDSDDADIIRHGHVVLAQLGDADAARWIARDDRERSDAFLESVGLLSEDRDGGNDLALADSTDDDVTATKLAAE